MSQIKDIRFLYCKVSKKKRNAQDFTLKMCDILR